jgi:hypothetical protein
MLWVLLLLVVDGELEEEVSVSGAQHTRERTVCGVCLQSLNRCGAQSKTLQQLQPERVGRICLRWRCMLEVDWGLQLVAVCSPLVARIIAHVWLE